MAEEPRTSSEACDLPERRGGGLARPRGVLMMRSGSACRPGTADACSPGCDPLHAGWVDGPLSSLPVEPGRRGFLIPDAQ
jgi:hypothetical protein